MKPRTLALFIFALFVATTSIRADSNSIPVAVAPGGLARACPTFHWSVVARATGYELAVYQVEGDAPAPLEKPVLHRRLPANVGGWTPPADRCLEPGTRYAWSVRALGQDRADGWSEPALFVVGAEPTFAEVEEALETLRRFRSEPQTKDRDNDEPAARATGLQPGGATAPASTVAETGSQSESLLIPGLSPSLVLDNQIHLGVASNIFRQGVPFLWTDGSPTGSGNLGVGLNALQANVGTRNTAVGNLALRNNTTGSSNSAFGEDTLRDNTAGSDNTAVGAAALRENETGARNTAVGHDALTLNTTGTDNTAVGNFSLTFAETASFNTALGQSALRLNTTGSQNAAVGHRALRDNTSGAKNTAIGQGSMRFNQAGSNNTALGEDALQNNKTGNNNIAIGRRAGIELGTTSDNIMVGSEGSIIDTATIRIGVQGTQLRTHIAGIAGISLSSGANVVVESDGRLGVGASSRRFKENIRDMEDVAGKVASLRPVRFRYRPKHSSSPDRPLEYGLIAEEVAEVLPELVARDPDGDPYAVRYDLLSALLLKELQSQKRTNRAVDLEQARLLAAHRREIAALESKLEALERRSRKRPRR